MKQKNPTSLITVFLIALVLSFQAAQGRPIFTPDTVRVNTMAKEVLQLLESKTTAAKADSILAEANQLTKAEKAEPTFFLRWANAAVAFKNSNYGKAFQFAAEAMKDQPAQIGWYTQGKMALFFAKTCQSTGQFSTGIEALEKNIELAKSHHMKGIIPWSCLGLAEIYEVGSKYPEAIRSLENMLEYANQENDLSAAEIACARLGKARLTYSRDFKLADQYFKQDLRLAEKLKDSTRISYALTNLGWNFYLEKKLDSSLNYYIRSLKFSLPIKRYSTIANSLGNIGTIYRDMKEYAKANAAWKKGLEYAELNRDWYTLSWIYNDMSLMAYGIGEYKKAYEYQLNYKQYSDSLGSQNYSEGLAKARTEFDADTKEKELQLLSLKLKNQRLAIYGFAGFLLLSLTIGILLLRQAQLKAKRRISEMDQKILEVTQANLRQQMNPHFIFNTLNSIQYYMYKHDKLATNNYLTKFSMLMRKILENSQHTAIPIRDELDALQLYLELESIRFRDKFDYQITVDEEIDPLMYKIPTMLIQPFVENAICHGLMMREQKGLVSITLNLQSDHLSCIIEDNGIGREASREINLKKQHNHNSLGTRITESRLKLVNAFYGKSLKTIYTDLKDDEGKALGTRVEIHIPILT
jgi:sensor histidine kinase YesM